MPFGAFMLVAFVEQEGTGIGLEGGAQRLDRSMKARPGRKLRNPEGDSDIPPWQISVK